MKKVLCLVLLAFSTLTGVAHAAATVDSRAESLARAENRLVEVWKSPTCGCCQAWIEHLQSNGFEVKANSVRDTAPFRAALGIPQSYGSCHSARVAGYALEGHVPAADIKKLLAEKPDAVGLAVPGMPMGSPGMEHPEDSQRRDAYSVMLIDKSGQAKPFTQYPKR